MCDFWKCESFEREEKLSCGWESLQEKVGDIRGSLHLGCLQEMAGEVGVFAMGNELAGGG